ncbi:elongator complex protein 6 [Epinephelus moara]|uniref:elongator complex protein 6 n=1 Tax=Epinephelus moara TaxID=300413 RepID=UPI00214E8F53|nr:elongator complex protein 6 [Epinephelus moara]
MFTELNSILNTKPDSVTEGEFILLSDRRSDASFLIHHFLSLYLRAGCRVWFVALVQSFNHYSGISQRLGVSLSQAKEKGQLVFLEGLKESLSVLIPQETEAGSEVMDFLRDPAAGLKSLYQFVGSSLTSGGGDDDDDEEGRGSPVLLVDDLSVLLSLGVSVGDMLDFSHYCRATVCSQLQVSTCVNCGVVCFQVEVCWRLRRGDGQHSQKKVFQYKVHDKGASFFAPGTSSAVL